MRKLLLILFVFTFSCVKAQTPMHWLTWKKTVAPLFDAFPSGQWGVSFRKLRQGYLGSCVRVRRMSDNVEQDIGFNGNFCDTVALKTFIGSSAARTVTWYDQSGNGLNFATVDTAHQPYMAYSSGTLLYNYGHALSMRSVQEGGFQNGNIRYLRNTFTGTSNASTFIVINEDSVFYNFILCLFSLEVNSSYFMVCSGGTNTAYSGIGTPLSYTNGVLRTIITRDSSEYYIVKPAAIRPILYSGLNLNMSTWSNASLAREGASTLPPPTYFTEYIMYGTDQTSNRLGIEANINSYYNIY